MYIYFIHLRKILNVSCLLFCHSFFVVNPCYLSAIMDQSEVKKNTQNIFPGFHLSPSYFS